MGIERELPVVAKKKAKVVVRRAAMVAARGTRVLLAQRIEGGTFGGMWEPPSVDAAASDLPAALRALVGMEVRVLEPVADVVHVLTHRRLEVMVYRGTLGPRLSAKDDGVAATLGRRDYQSFRWQDPAEGGSFGVTTFARKILAAALGQKLRFHST